MPRTRVEVEAELDRLQPRDFNDRNSGADGLERLHALIPEFVSVSEPEDASRTILGLVERLSDSQEIDPAGDLGTPGPMVHALEKLRGYEPLLIESVQRFPTPLTVWMVNRIMNTLEKGSDRWAQLLELLKRSAVAVRAAPGARESAEDFILYQES
jgi:hypothetical protein